MSHGCDGFCTSWYQMVPDGTKWTYHFHNSWNSRYRPIGRGGSHPQTKTSIAPVIHHTRDPSLTRSISSTIHHTRDPSHPRSITPTSITPTDRGHVHGGGHGHGGHGDGHDHGSPLLLTHSRNAPSAGRDAPIMGGDVIPDNGLEP